MERTIIAAGLALLGLLLGSFIGASTWRLRARQLKADKADGESVDARELKQLSKLNNKTFQTDRSQCLYCGHQLAWYDLLPLVSWLRLGGRCRYCRRPIGWFEPLIELCTAAFLVLSYIYWPHPLDTVIAVVVFALWLISGLGLLLLLCYDAKWFLLPDKVMFPVITIAAISALLQIAAAPVPAEALLSVLLGCVILSGLYFVLHVASRGKMIGFGDIKLGLALALLLADWRLALVALFLANLIGTMIVLPGLLTKRLSRTSRVPFGPMLIAGWFVAGLWGERLIAWYLFGWLGY